jgi:hypothetical protein
MVANDWSIGVWDWQGSDVPSRDHSTQEACMTTPAKRCSGWPHAVAIVFLIGALFTGCSRTGPEQQLRRQIAQLQVGVQARDLSSIRAALADDFVGPEGMDRTAAIRLAQVAYLQNQRINAVFGPLQVTLLPSATNPDHATVAFSAALTGGSGGGMPDTARLYQVRTGWRLQDGDWRMTSADWTSTP